MSQLNICGVGIRTTWGCSSPASRCTSSVAQTLNITTLSYRLPMKSSMTVHMYKKVNYNSGACISGLNVMIDVKLHHSGGCKTASLNSTFVTSEWHPARINTASLAVSTPPQIHSCGRSSVNFTNSSLYLINSIDSHWCTYEMYVHVKYM